MSCGNPTTFLTRLSERMRERGVSRQALMDGVSGIGPIKLSRMFEGGWQPNIFMTRQIAKLLDCSPDWLLGNTEDPTPIKAEPSPLVVETSWVGFYRWLTDRRYMGTRPPWDPQDRTIADNVPVWLYALDNAVREGCDDNDCFDDLTDLEIQVICNWIRHRSARRHRPSMSLFAPGPKVLQLNTTRAMRAGGLGA